MVTVIHLIVFYIAAVLSTSLQLPASCVPVPPWCRSGAVQQVTVKVGFEDGMGTNRVVHWCGAQLQVPHRAVRELGYLPPSAGVFISRWHHGSPSHRCAGGWVHHCLIKWFVVSYQS